MRHIRVLISSCLIMAIAYGEDPSLQVNGPSISGEEEVKVEAIIPVGNENYLNEKSDYIYNQDKIATFELNLPAAALRKLDNDSMKLILRKENVIIISL